MAVWLINHIYIFIHFYICIYIYIYTLTPNVRPLFGGYFSTFRTPLKNNEKLLVCKYEGQFPHQNVEKLHAAFSLEISPASKFRVHTSLDSFGPQLKAKQIEKQKHRQVESQSLPLIIQKQYDAKVRGHFVFG